MYKNPKDPKFPPFLSDRTILTKKTADGAGYVELKPTGDFWVPLGTSRYNKYVEATAEEELATAKSFFTPILFVELFGSCNIVCYDDKFVVPTEVVDELENRRKRRMIIDSCKPRW